MKKFSSLFLIFFIFFTIDVAYSIDWTNSAECTSRLEEIHQGLKDDAIKAQEKFEIQNIPCMSARNEEKKAYDHYNEVVDSSILENISRSREEWLVASEMSKKLCDANGHLERVHMSKQSHLRNFESTIKLFPDNVDPSPSPKEACQMIAKCIISSSRMFCDRRINLMDILNAFDRFDQRYFREQTPVVTVEEEEKEDETESEASQGSRGGGGEKPGTTGMQRLNVFQFQGGASAPEGIVTVEEEEASTGVR